MTDAGGFEIPAESDQLRNISYADHPLSGGDNQSEAWSVMTQETSLATESTDQPLIPNLLHLLLTAPNIIITILAFLGIVANIIGVMSLLKQRMNKKDCTRSRILLLISLSFSDILTCAGYLIKPYIKYLLIKLNLEIEAPITHDCTTTFLDGFIISCHTITLLNLLGMAVDHWITFTKPFRYFALMSKKRALIMIASFWIFGLMCTVAEFSSGLHHIKKLKEQANMYNDMTTPQLPDSTTLVFVDVTGQGDMNASSEAIMSYHYDWDYDSDEVYYYNYCHAVNKDHSFHPDYVLYALAPFCLIAMIIIYCRIYKEIKQLVVAPPPQQDFGQARRALYTTLVILGTFLLCWLPMFSLHIVMQLLGVYKKFKDLQESTQLALIQAVNWLFIPIMINCILHPIIYMSHLRMKLSALCRGMLYKISSQYDTVRLDDETRRQEIIASHTMTTMRSSVQMSAIGSAAEGGC